MDFFPLENLLNFDGTFLSKIPELFFTAETYVILADFVYCGNLRDFGGNNVFFIRIFPIKE